MVFIDVFMYSSIYLGIASCRRSGSSSTGPGPDPGLLSTLLTEILSI